MFTIMGNIKIRFCALLSFKMGNSSKFEEDGKNQNSYSPITREGNFLFPVWQKHGILFSLISILCPIFGYT